MTQTKAYKDTHGWILGNGAGAVEQEDEEDSKKDERTGEQRWGGGVQKNQCSDLLSSARGSAEMAEGARESGGVAQPVAIGIVGQD